ncbi:phosphonate ABC transporter ATP-binding protein [Halomonas sp. G15]|uniref:phosphonate ABC transporter ATP-binding protein n=1 Tax=unclassified Halomonas TaxID=2609666 RepID=UPI001E58471C|nr:MULTISPECIES: phosphonate ABC transporter ATP-binding protein [unclassified Halomonas]MCE0732294.1 phosphonate ABC transporter ATP-binding protein [Halomonas sp. G15]
MTASIHVEGLDKSFGPRAALCGIDFTIEAGEMVTLIGPSGSGKSTLLRHLIGLSRADHQSCSQVEVLGRTVQRYGRLLAAGRNQRRRSGYIFQQFNLVGRLSVLSNVLIGCLGAMPRWRSLTGRFNQKERDLALRALERVGIVGLAHQRANTLSGGQMQRVAIARTLVQDAEVIFADEPIASLDPRSAREVMEILQRINHEDGRTIVVTLHQVDVARRYCRRAIALKQGRLYYDGPIEGLTDARLQALYENAGLDELNSHNSRLEPAAPLHALG